MPNRYASPSALAPPNHARSGMSLDDIHIAGVRCLDEARLQLAPGLTLIWGGNGSGKTSVLESVYMLGRGRSFRTRNNSRLIKRDKAVLRIIGQACSATGQPAILGIEVGIDGTKARISGRDVESLAELSQAFAVQVIDPGIHRLIEEAGYRRRRWLDWSVFHVEPLFMEHWTQYTRALKQRNAALKIGEPEAVVWDGQLVRLGELITKARQDLMQRLAPYWRETVTALSGLDVDIHYQQGWSHEQTLGEALLAWRARDVVRQVTHAGPHRADVAVRVRGRPAKEVLSRGQQKLIAAALTIAQLKLLKDATAITPTLLLDDPAAELDAFHLERFVGEVSRLRCQLVVTSLHAESRLFGAPDRTFRMEEGTAHPV
jgi:DNA replication and repair protein RecF